jgi:hypothetical protein
MRRTALALALTLAAALTACGSPCQDLGNRICKCSAEGAVRESCERAVEEQVESGNPRPGSNDQDFCEEKLDSCADPDDDPAMCDRLETEAGKRACGLAY